MIRADFIVLRPWCVE